MKNEKQGKATIIFENIINFLILVTMGSSVLYLVMMFLGIVN